MEEVEEGLDLEGVLKDLAMLNEGLEEEEEEEIEEKEEEELQAPAAAPTEMPARNKKAGKELPRVLPPDAEGYPAL